MSGAGDLGHAAAGEVRRLYGDLEVDALAERMGVAVESSDRDGGYGTVIVFADYTPRPPRIRLYRRAIEALDAQLAGYPDHDRLPAGTRPLFLAHELFHHWEALHPGERKDREQSEHAAGSFAMALLGLTCHPEQLDRLARRVLQA
jgi:hypothetical protein